MVFQSYRRFRRTSGQLYTWGLFWTEVGPREFVQRLEISASIFRRGLPRNEDLQDPAIARIFSDVLREGSILHSDPRTGDGTTLRRCYHNGWFHADKPSEPRFSEDTVYTFPSPLHRWFVEWKLYDIVPAESFESNNILELVLEVIAGFSTNSLSAERRIGDACIQRPTEAQYQDEFYRCCRKRYGLLTTFSEFGTAEGRVDFYMPSKQWAVELLREGDQLKQHSERFSPSGSFGKKLPLSDYIILDCHNTPPTHPQPGMCILCPSICFPYSS